MSIKISLYVICFLALVSLGFSVDSAFANDEFAKTCALALKESSHAQADPVSAPAEATSSLEKITNVFFGRFLSDVERQRHVSAILSLARDDIDNELDPARILLESQLISRQTKYAIIGRLRADVVSVNLSDELLFSELLVPFYRSIGCENCVDEQTKRFTDALGDDELTAIQISRLYRIGVVSGNELAGKALVMACSAGDQQSIDTLVLALYKDELSPTGQTVSLNELIEQAGTRGAPDSLHLTYLSWLEKREPGSKIKDSEEAVSLLFKASIAGSTESRTVLSKLLRLERSKSSRSLLVAAFLATNAAESGNAGAGIHLSAVLWEKKMDLTHWSLSIDQFAFAAVAGTPRQKAVVVKRLGTDGPLAQTRW